MLSLLSLCCRAIIFSVFNHLSSRALSCIPGCHYLSPATSTYLRSLYLIISYFSYCCHFFRLPLSFFDCRHLSTVIFLGCDQFSWLRSFSSDAGCQHLLRMLAVIIFRLPLFISGYQHLSAIFVFDYIILLLLLPFFYDCHYLSLTTVIYLRSFSSAATSFLGCGHFPRMPDANIFFGCWLLSFFPYECHQFQHPLLECHQFQSPFTRALSKSTSLR